MPAFAIAVLGIVIGGVVAPLVGRAITRARALARSRVLEAGSCLPSAGIRGRAPTAVTGRGSVLPLAPEGAGIQACTAPGVSSRRSVLRPWYVQAFPVTCWAVTRLLRLLLHGPQPVRYVLTRWLFLRLLGLVYLIAFVSLLVQIPGLIGRRGILPAEDFLDEVKANTDRNRYWQFPTVAWLNAGDNFLRAIAGTGAALSLMVFVGVDSAPVMLALWALYLSLSTVSRDFLGFQWDALLLETGFISTLFAPWKIPVPRLSSRLAPRVESSPPMIILWSLRWLLFRLMLSSGAVKRLSGDRTWRKLTALNYHYETQPLATPLSWYAAKLPKRFQKFSVAMVFVVELGIPFLIFAPRPFRVATAAALTSFQFLIAATGNYTFFNLLTVVLCTSLLDDGVLEPLLPASTAQRVAQLVKYRVRFDLNMLLVPPVAGAVALVTSAQMLSMFGKRSRLPRSIRRLLVLQSPFHIVNSYGLFAVMTTSRPEIIVEGSNDGFTWLEYEFKHKPGDPQRPPTWVAPHQPRLDWQMWFAALSDHHNNPWFVSFMVRVLQGSEPVLALMAKNPFPDAPPRYIRALLYDYQFTDWKTRRETGAWWRRHLLGVYFPQSSLWGNQIPRME